MARPLRLELAGGLYDVTSRGDRREDIYFGDTDRHAWFDIFRQVCARFNWVCHAWCQMTNHYHIVVETIEGNLVAVEDGLTGSIESVQYADGSVGKLTRVVSSRNTKNRDSYPLDDRNLSCN